ncbi:ABC transporter substrate-binding protein [Falsirhodobacter xinxiangensis]|uniref:ABC transporter substrate-binding protein n=1 Tax=Falsirhodobacter xinxiangensis TaxID=2530049 RepID=UPI0010AB174B|nr:ABC transporter substrate-binding protein [Rhodobacter xinxiangensis]
MRLSLLALALLPLPALGQSFPQAFTHRYGETLLPAAPERVVSLGYVGHDNILALGVVPVGLRYWYGDNPDGVWPWAEPALQGQHPIVLRGEVSLERIAVLDPDVIIAVSSGITAEEYAVLSRIAPTIASEAQYGDFTSPWQVHARTIGRALGREAEAEAQIAAIKARFAAIREDHPDWQGASGIAAYLWAGSPGAFTAGDGRVEILQDMGFALPAALATGSSFFTEFSSEDLSIFDTDLLVWINAGDDLAPLRNLTLRKTLAAHREGREVYADYLLAGAMAHGTLLSLPWTLDRLVPQIEAAMDGDPATPVSSAAEAGLAP